MAPDIAAAAASIPKEAMGALGEALFIVAGALIVGTIVGFAMKSVPGLGNWAPEIALVISAVLLYFFRTGIFGKLALGALTAAALAVLYKWAVVLKLPVALTPSVITGGA